MDISLKNLKNYYNITEHENKYLLFSKTEQGKRFGRKYKWFLTKENNDFLIEGYAPKNIQDLIDNVNKKVDFLPYDSEYYTPSLVDGSFEMFIIHDYMISLGFEWDGFIGMGANISIYKLTNKNIYGKKNVKCKMSFGGLDTFQPEEKISIVIDTSNYSFVEAIVNRNVEEIKKCIDAMLKPLFLTDAAQDIISADKLENTVVELEKRLLDFSSKDFMYSKKIELKEKLQKIIDLL